MTLSNANKRRFCNAFMALLRHQENCDPCNRYLCHIEGDLCGVGKDIIDLEMTFEETDGEVLKHVEIDFAKRTVKETTPDRAQL